MIDHASNVQNAVCTNALVAAIDPRTGRQVIGLLESSIVPPLIKIWSTGGRWIDDDGHEWVSTTTSFDVSWRHSTQCVCRGARALL